MHEEVKMFCLRRLALLAERLTAVGDAAALLTGIEEAH